MELYVGQSINPASASVDDVHGIWIHGIDRRIAARLQRFVETPIVVTSDGCGFTVTPEENDDDQFCLRASRRDGGEIRPEDYLLIIGVATGFVSGWAQGRSSAFVSVVRFAKTEGGAS